MYVEEFLELQSDTGLFQVFGVLGIVDGAEGFVTPHEVAAGDNEVGQGLWQGRQLLDKCLGKPFHGTGVQPRLLHLLRRVVVGL